MTEEPMGQLAAAIASGEVEVNPHLTPEQQRAFAEHVRFYDDVIARGMAQVEVERRELIERGLMAEDGKLINLPDVGQGGGHWLAEMERESLPEARPASNG